MSEAYDYNPDAQDVMLPHPDGWIVYGEGGEITVVDPKGNPIFDSPDGAATDDTDILLTD